MKIVPINVLVDRLEGKALNFAVQKSLGCEVTEDGLGYWVALCAGEGYEVQPIPDYIGNLTIGWALLNDLKISYRVDSNGIWASLPGSRPYLGKSYSEAGLRCFVGCKFPNEIIEIPTYLL